jgi:hypothetical protein
VPSAFFNRFNDSRQRGLVYPSPFFDIAQTYMPPTVKELFKWCTYYFYTHPIINPVVYKMAEYPITELLYHKKDVAEDSKQNKKDDKKVEPDSIIKDAYKEVLEKILDIKSFLINSGLDYFTFGNTFVSLSFPFIRYLQCMGCKKKLNITSLPKKSWKYEAFKFMMECPDCKVWGQAKVEDDHKLKDRSELRLIRWDPEDINIHFNKFTGKSTYTYTIPENLKKSVRVGNQDDVIDTPMRFLQAVQNNMDLKFEDKNFFHLKRCTLADKDQGWGKPLILPAMRDAFYLQILRKANEAIAFQYIVPLTVLFPQPHGNIDPYKHMNLGKWRERVEQEIAQWKNDHNYIPVMPVPIGNQQIWGNAKALMVTPEIRALSEQMVTGMGVPTEFIFGGLSYSGSSVSLRIVENHLLRYRESMLRLLQFIVERVRLYCNFEKIDIEFQQFKMADDIQQQQLLAQFVQGQQVSIETGLEQLDIPFRDEKSKIRDEVTFMNELAEDQMISQAEAQGKASLIMAKYQTEAEMAAQMEQLKQQNALLRENPAAAEQMMMMQQQMMMAQQGMPAEGGVPPEQAAPVPAEAAPEQTQSMQPEQAPQVQPGYGHGNDIEFGEETAFDPRLLALQMHAQMQGLQPGQRRQFDHLFKTQMPGLHGLMSQVQQNQQRFKTEKPMPTQLPPRRKGGSPV